SIINETSPFVIIISTTFLFRYLIKNNELISMRNIGFSIFDIFQPIGIGIFTYGLLILIIVNPITAISETKYNKYLDNQNENTYSIKFSENNLWIKNKKNNDGIYYINIKNFDIKEMIARDIEILSIQNTKREFFQSDYGAIEDKNFVLTEVNQFDILNDKFFNHKKFLLDLNFTKESILTSNINYKNIPYYNYLNHVKTMKKFNLYSSAVGLFYLSEILKPIFMILLAFVVMSFSAKYKRNESFFKILFIAVLIGFSFYILREIINKFTITFNINFVFSYFIIFIIPFIIGIYKTIQIEND
ncbi:LptF/LptG family permease, partial [Alphaproteobacteria bacterium]|nr:LptF/LptG family permease [Alphaproteobacteria bacterium]